MAKEGESTPELLMRAVGSLRRNWREQLEPLGISPHQGRALQVIADAAEIRPSELARSLRIAPRSATEVVDNLVERGLAERRNSRSDRRAVIVSPTAEGTALIRRLHTAQRRAQQEMLRRLSDADEAQLRRILRKMIEP